MPSSDESESRRKGPSVGVRFAVCAGAGALGGLVVAIVGPWWLIPLSGWDTAALLFVSWMWHSLWPLDAADTAKEARRENPRRAAADALLLSASVASLIAVSLVLVRAGQRTAAFGAIRAPRCMWAGNRARDRRCCFCVQAPDARLWRGAGPPRSCFAGPCLSMIGSVRVVQRNVKNWSSGETCMRWTAAGMLEAESRFRKVPGYHGLARSRSRSNATSSSATDRPSPIPPARSPPKPSLCNRHNRTAVTKDPRPTRQSSRDAVVRREAGHLARACPVVPDRVSARRLDRGGLRAKRSSRGPELVDERSLSRAAA